MPDVQAALVPGAAIALVPSGVHSGPQGQRPFCSSGATQLASALARSLWQAGAVNLLAWVDATSRAAILSGFQDTVVALGLHDLADAEATAARLLAWLRATSSPWLIVLDGVRAAADVDGLVPAGPAGRVLITAADAAALPAGDDRRLIPVPPYSTREALAFISNRLNVDKDQRAGGIDLAADLEGDPVALGHAVAVVANSGFRCRDYQEAHYAPRRAQLTDTPRAVTCSLSAAHAEQLYPSGGTWLILLLAAVLAASGIPGSVFTTDAAAVYLGEAGALRHPGARGTWTAVLALERAGLLTVDHAGSPPVVFAGQPVQEAVRAAAPPPLLRRAVRAAADALAETWPAGQPRSWLAAACRASAAALLAVAGDWLWEAGACHPLLVLAGQSLEAAGLTAAAADWWHRTAAACERLLGPGHLDTVVAARKLAEALMAAGRPADAVACFETIAAREAAAQGPDHPVVIAAKVGLGDALARCGKPGDAAAVLAEASASGMRTWGTRAAASVAVREAHARACLAADHAGQAVTIYTQCLADRERLHGQSDPAALATRAQLAAAYLAAGRRAEAVAERERVAAGLEAALGADHTETLRGRADVADAYLRSGKMRAALDAYERASKDYGRVFGPCHPETLIRQADLARAYAAAGQLDAALPLLAGTISSSERALSPDDPLTRTLRQALDDITGRMT